MAYIKRVKEACEKAARITKFKLSLSFDTIMDDRVIITYSFVDIIDGKRVFRWGTMVFTDWQIEQKLINANLNDFYKYFIYRIMKLEE